jgi:membrane protein YqaA with SNARE-associated domain
MNSREKGPLIRFSWLAALDLLGWMDSLVATYGYLGFFVYSMFGNMSIFLPFPYALVIYTFGSRLDPVPLGIVCGLGAAIGEFSAYFVGRGGRKLLESKYGKQLNSVKLLIQRYGAFAIFLFAMTPMPDDLLFIVLGLIKFDWKKALVACFLGKWLMCTTLAYAGKFSYGFVLQLFEGGGYLGIVVGFILLALVIVAMIKIDWTRFLPGGGEKGSPPQKTDSGQ